MRLLAAKKSPLGQQEADRSHLIELAVEYIFCIADNFSRTLAAGCQAKDGHLIEV